MVDFIEGKYRFCSSNKWIGCEFYYRIAVKNQNAKGKTKR